MDRTLPSLAGIGPVAYRFGEFRLAADGTLWRGDTALDLSRRELALLRALLTRTGEVVSSDELTYAVWGDADDAGHRLAACLATLKERLQSSDCIESVYRCGYRIAAIVEREVPSRTSALPLLAILPFSTGYDVPEYLGLAVAEQGMERLSCARPAVASIAAWASVCALARRGLPAQEIGKMLRVEMILTGQVLATPGRRRLRVEMLRVKDGAPLWVEDLIAEREQIAELAGELADRVTSRLRAGAASIAVEAGAMYATQHATSPAEREAHELYLRAHYEWQNMERHQMQNAMGRLLRAVELYPALMAARTDLAQLAVLQCIYGYLSPRIAAATVRRASEGIPELNAQAQALLPALAWMEFHFDRDARSALRMMARSAELPYDATSTRVRAWLLLSRHRFGEAIELLRAAIHIDPYAPWLRAALAWALHLAGERDASVEQILQAIDLSSQFDKSLFFGVMILGFNGDGARAIALAETLEARSSHYDLALSAHAYALACAGRVEESHSLLERMQWLSRERFVLNTLNAATHVVLGHADAALEELLNANEIRCPWFFQMLADPRLRPLKEWPEFAELEATLAAMEADASA